jgi:hypothetical protein
MEYIIGVLVSLFAQWTKRTFGTAVLGTYISVFLISLVGAAIYVYLKDTDLWPVLVQIVTVAGAFYAFVIRRFEED